MRHAARASLSKFFEAVIEADWPRVQNVTQTSWLNFAKEKGHDALEQLESKIGALGIIEVIRIGEAKPVKYRKAGKVKTVRVRGRARTSRSRATSPCMVDARVLLRVTLGDEENAVRLELLVRLVRETADGKAAPTGPGTWGVNPASMFRSMKALDPVAEG